MVSPRALLHRRAGRQTNGRIRATNDRYGVIQDISPVDVVDIRRPTEAATWQVDLGALAREDRAVARPWSAITHQQGMQDMPTTSYSPLQVRAGEDLKAFIGGENEVLLEFGIVPEGGVAKYDVACGRPCE